jgi:hypothetical protein
MTTPAHGGRAAIDGIGNAARTQAAVYTVRHRGDGAERGRPERPPRCLT